MNAIALSEAQMLQVMSSATSSGFEYLLPLFSAALDGRIQLFILPRGAPWPTRELRQSKLPALVVIGDDDHNTSGPDGWPSEIRQFARHAMIHAAAGSVGTYKIALTNCVLSRRYVLVETSSSRMEDWLEFFKAAPKRIPLDVVKTRDGAQHPIPREKMQ